MMEVVYQPLGKTAICNLNPISRLLLDHRKSKSSFLNFGREIINFVFAAANQRITPSLADPAPSIAKPPANKPSDLTVHSR